MLNKRNQCVQNGFFIKKFEISSFVDYDWKDRIEKHRCIHHFGSNFPQIHYQINELDNNLIQRIPHIKKIDFKCQTYGVKKSVFDEFCLAVDYLRKSSLVHGDILMKNIVYNGREFVLLDFEPSLKIKNTSNKEVLKVTYPWIHVDDLKLGNISSKTDLLCLNALELYIFDKFEYYNLRENQMKKLQMQNLVSQTNINSLPIIPNINLDY